MGLFDIFKKKGLNPNVQFNSELRYLNGAALQNYESGKYVNEGYLGNADVYVFMCELGLQLCSVILLQNGTS
jgi:hypothetical protein